MSLKNWFKFFGLSLVWGTSFFWIKIGLQEVNPITLVFFRVFFATLGLVIFFLITRKQHPLKFWWLYLFLGFFNVALPFILITWSETHISSGMASVMNSTQPLATAIFAAIFIREERLTPQRIIGLVVGFSGVLMLMSDRLNGRLDGQLLGILAMTAAVLSYGGSSVFARLKNKGVSPESQAFGQMAFGLIFLIPAMLVFESPFVLPKLPLSYIAFAWLGLLGSFIASILWYKLLNDIGPSRVSMTTYLLPLIGITLGAIVLDEKIGWRLLAGGILIILGIIIVNRKKTLAGSLTAAASQEKG
ncbi:MAG: EamA family transporter [Anaerolineaceae bacterium]|nr:EamA family transporter [Anaerolineaceae bacterium]